MFMNYRAALIRAARSSHKAIDIDVQVSADGTPWALHWGVVGKNRLHDPDREIPATARIVNLTDYEISRLRSVTGAHAHRLSTLLFLAAKHRVRVEAELKTHVAREQIHHLLAMPSVADMHARGDLQFKTLANLPGCVRRLRAAHLAGGTTVLTFTNYHGPGIDATRAWPVTDYVRGTPKWINVPR
jgi:hypothetical protein